MISTLVDPVILGQLLSIAFIFSLFLQKGKRRIFYCITFVTALIMTLAKGAILITLISFLLLFRKTRQINKYVSNMILIVCAVLLLIFLDDARSNVNSINSHVEGFVTGINSLLKQPFGYGIGEVGNFANLFTKGSGMDIGGESFIGALIGQIGFIGIAVYACFIKIFSRVSKSNLVIFCLGISILISSLVNMTAISFTNIYIVFILTSVPMSSPVLIGELNLAQNHSLIKNLFLGDRR
ncbi:hypothetical protein FACS1894111_07030 [Clostridia bacterium]|nr:hypothetical protein FACS1894111_07030 [Clostridia bacterium]